VIQNDQVLPCGLPHLLREAHALGPCQSTERACHPCRPGFRHVRWNADGVHTTNLLACTSVENQSEGVALISRHRKCSHFEQIQEPLLPSWLGISKRPLFPGKRPLFGRFHHATASTHTPRVKRWRMKRLTARSKHCPTLFDTQIFMPPLVK
jgi:hypothetical protein